MFFLLVLFSFFLDDVYIYIYFFLYIYLFFQTGDVSRPVPFNIFRLVPPPRSVFEVDEKEHKHLSNEHLDCLGYIVDYTTQFKDPY